MSTDATPNLSSLDFWARPQDEREAGFRWLRDSEPLSWQPQPDGVLMPTEEGSGGYWAITRFDDIRTISRDAERFVSGNGVMLEDVPAELLEASQSFLAMDAPRHKQLRGLVQAGFTPRQVRHLDEGIRADVATILDDLEEVPGGEGDFVEHVAKRLPLMTIMRMLGVPEDEREALVDQADAMVSWNDPEFLAGREPLMVVGGAIGALHEACGRYCAQRREEPGEDLLSALVQAEVDGERLTDAEIASFFVLLSVAGNDTTRHTTSHAMQAITDAPDQRAALLADLETTVEPALDEFVRWASPVIGFRRTVAAPVEVQGRTLQEGEKVMLFYPSGNRDERAIADPYRFDVTRSPNRHVGFGGGGPHFCMGAALAKLQMQALFTGLLGRYPELETADGTYLVGNFVNGVTRLPMTLGPRAA